MSASAPKDSPLGGPRTGRETRRLTELTVERARTDPHPLAKRFTKFKTNYKDPIKIGDVISDTGQAVKTHPVGQVPED